MAMDYLTYNQFNIPTQISNGFYEEDYYPDYLETEEIILPLGAPLSHQQQPLTPPSSSLLAHQHYQIPQQQQQLNLSSSFGPYYNNNNRQIGGSAKYFNILDYNNTNSFNANSYTRSRLNIMNKQGYQLIEEEIINMSQRRSMDGSKSNGLNGLNGMDSLINNFNSFMKTPTKPQITEEHIDLTGGADLLNQRRPSFKRQLTAPSFQLQDSNGQLNIQRSASAQNIYMDSRLAEGERNLNYCVRFAVNGLSKSHMGGIPSINRNIQAGDFGDDAGMIAENSKCIVIGLADGAGGNREIGIDPKKFSRSLLGFCVEIIKNEEIQPHQVTKLVTKAVQHLENRNIVGSGTLCVLSLNKDTNIMSAFNMGDSGFRLLRQGKIRHKSTATMAGSSPRQIFVSESQFNGISFVNEQEIGRDSDLREFRVKKGDFIIMSSDGLFDVLGDHDIERVVNSHNPKDLQGIADELLALTMRSYVHTHRDDILIMVCRIELKRGFM